MLTELKNARQVNGEPFRRWFTDEYFDLIVWQTPENTIVAFQLCYDKGPGEKALTWQQAGGYTHKGVDDGEGREGYHKMTPILIPDGSFERDPILQRFFDASYSIDPVVRAFVIERLSDYSSRESI